MYFQGISTLADDCVQVTEINAQQDPLNYNVPAAIWLEQFEIKG